MICSAFAKHELCGEIKVRRRHAGRGLLVNA
jgi:hypothetical protein